MSNINSFPIPTTPFSASALGVLEVANNLSDVADASTSRTNLGLAIGTDVQAYSVELDTYVANSLTAAELGELQNIDSTTISAAQWGYLGGASAFGGSLIDDADAAAARTTLGLAIGTDVQAFDAGLQSISGLTTSADQGIYTTGADTYATFSLTAAGRALLDDADAAAQRTTLGAAGIAVNENITGIWAGANAKSLAALKARSVAGLTGGEVIQLSDGGRSGQFTWVTGDQSALVALDPEEGINVAPASDPTGASGVWARIHDGQSFSIAWFGARPDLANNAPAINAAIDWAAKRPGAAGGRVLVPPFVYPTLAPVEIGKGADADEVNVYEGIILEGSGVREVWRNEAAGKTPSASTILAGHTDGDAVRVRTSSVTIRNLKVDATSTRRAASPNSNYGIRFEALDNAEGFSRVNIPVVEDVFILGQPNWGLLVIGFSVGQSFRRVSIREGGAGIAIDRGDVTGRTNKSRPGIGKIELCRCSDLDGHSIAIGHPENGSITPYRIVIDTFETFRCATAPGLRYNDHSMWVRGQTVLIKNTAAAGVHGTDPSAPVLFIAGWDVKVTNFRPVGVDTTGNWGSHAITIGNTGAGAGRTADDIEGVDTGAGGYATNGVVIDGGMIFPAITNLVFAEPGVSNVTIQHDLDVGNVTNLLDPSTIANVTGLTRRLGSKVPYQWRVAGVGAVAQSHTGDLVETTLASVQIPAGLIGPNGVVRISAVWSCTNSANTKTFRIRFGTAAGSGTAYLTRTATTSGTVITQQTISNRNSASSQVGAHTSGEFGAQTAAVTTSTRNTNNESFVSFSALLDDITETITLESYIVEVCHAP
jgi:hypothetical protein